MKEEKIKNLLKQIQNNELIEVIITDCNLFDYELKALSSSIKQNKTVKTVTIRNVLFYIKDTLNNEDSLRQDMLAVYLSGYLLKGNNNLENINLSENQINDQGVIFLVGVLKYNDNLKTLNLSCNHISDGGAKAVAELIKTNSGLLENIDLSNNKISIEGVVSINTAIQSLVFERFVNLSNNPGVIQEFIDCKENVETYNQGFSKSLSVIYEYYSLEETKTTGETIGEIDKSDIPMY